MQKRTRLLLKITLVLTLALAYFITDYIRTTSYDNVLSAIIENPEEVEAIVIQSMLPLLGKIATVRVEDEEFIAELINTPADMILKRPLLPRRAPIDYTLSFVIKSGSAVIFFDQHSIQVQGKHYIVQRDALIRNKLYDVIRRADLEWEIY